MVQIRARNRGGLRARGEASRILETAVAVAQQYAYVV